MYLRSVMPRSIGRLCVEGGAPYLDSHLTGRPQYEPDTLDTRHSYPDLSLCPSPLTLRAAMRAMEDAMEYAIANGQANML